MCHTILVWEQVKGSLAEAVLVGLVSCSSMHVQSKNFCYINIVRIGLTMGASVSHDINNL